MPASSARLFSRLAPWLLVGIAAGCPNARTSALVSGKVTVGGQPLADVAVVFEPIGTGAGRGSSGTTDASGSYTLRFVDNDSPGALIGRHQVTFRDLKASAEGGDAGGLPKQQFRFRQKYVNEGQEFEVKAGNNQADFDLK